MLFKLKKSYALAGVGELCPNLGPHLVLYSHQTMFCRAGGLLGIGLAMLADIGEQVGVSGEEGLGSHVQAFVNADMSIKTEYSDILRMLHQLHAP